MPTTDADRKAILTLKMLAVDGVEKAKSGHPGAPLGCAEMAYTLWSKFLRFNPADPKWVDRDRFVLSNGHASMLLYSLLHLFGYDLSLDELKRFRQLGSKTPGHPEYGLTPGVEVTTGPLGQGFAHAVGMALSSKMLGARFPKKDGFSPATFRVWGICGDGDLQEGVASEAASLAGHWKLDNLVFLYDDNHITIDGDTKLSFTEDVCKRFEAYGWFTERIDGNDADQVERALGAAKNRTGQPTLIAARTVIGHGSPKKAGTRHAHGEPLGADEMKATKTALGWPLEPTFLIPDDAKATFAKIIAEKKTAYETWEKGFAGWRTSDAASAKKWDEQVKPALPDDFDAQIASAVGDKENATRSHSGAALQKVAAMAPWIVGGSADLAPSNNTMIESPVKDGEWSVSVQPGTFEARNFHFGVREHGMIAIVNGMTLTGAFRAYGASFLIFTDYCRPAIRLGALMHLPAIYPFTHDSVFLGEDGPTHQPIEHFAALRAIPNLHFFRPADGLETAMAWAWAISTPKGPSIFGLTRQKLPPLSRPAGFTRRDVWKGGYTVLEPATAPEAVVISTGSEVAITVAAVTKLNAAGRKIRVVSMPCTTLFDAQPDAYRNQVLPQSLPIAAVEAAHPMSWHKYTGRDGLILGISTFGESAPAADLAKHFGFTTEQIGEKLEGWLKARR